MLKQIGILLIATAMSVVVWGQDYRKEVIQDETKVPAYVLPELLVDNDGQAVATKKQWKEKRRQEVMTLFKEYVYGYLPDAKVEASYKVLEQSDQALDGKATRKQIEITWTGNGTSRKALLLMYLPNAKKKSPVFVNFNFLGNATLSADPDVIPSQYSRQGIAYQKRRWPLHKIIDAGYGVATLHYYDIYFDEKGNVERSILPLLGINSEADMKPNSGRAIAVWAWGYSRVLDYLLTDKQVDGKRVVCMGHSRLGKTALWAGAQDDRFAIVISNNSGCGGAALSRRAYGETVNIINHTFPWWFCDNFKQYNKNEAKIPVDQHELLALAAPRPLYVASAVEDQWADPKGEFLSASLVEGVYHLFGYKGLKTDKMPSINQPIGDRVAYHIRSGVHDVTDYDWENYIRFANRWLYKK